jgi:hypothetical protein
MIFADNDESSETLDPLIRDAFDTFISLRVYVLPVVIFTLNANAVNLKIP